MKVHGALQWFFYRVESWILVVNRFHVRGHTALLIDFFPVCRQPKSMHTPSDCSYLCSVERISVVFVIESIEMVPHANAHSCVEMKNLNGTNMQIVFALSELIVRTDLFFG